MTYTTECQIFVWNLHFAEHLLGVPAPSALLFPAYSIFSLFCYFFRFAYFLSFFCQKLVYRRKIIVTDANIYDKYRNGLGRVMQGEV